MSVMWNFTMICFTHKRLSDKISLFWPKEIWQSLEDKIDPQHVHLHLHLHLHLQVIKSVFHGDVGFILAVILCFHGAGCRVRVSIPE